MNKNKHLLILLAVVLLSPLSSIAQNNKNIGIGTSNPDPSAILDITSVDKGILVPRLTSAQIAGINTPAEGLMVYNMDSACYFYYNNFSWVSLCAPGTASNGAHIAIVNGRTDVQLGGPLLQDTEIPLAGKKLTFSTTGTGGNVGVGNNNPDPSAVLDLTNSNNTGILIPKMRLTQTSVAAPVTAPATGLMIFNTVTLNDVTPGYYFWDGAKWMRIFSTDLPVVSTVSVTAPIVNTGTAQDPNIGLTTSNLVGKGMVAVTNGTNVLAGGTSADIDVVGVSGGVLYGTGTSSNFTTAGTAGEYLRSNGSAAPAWTTGSDVLGSSVVNVTNGTSQLVGGTNMNIDVNGPQGTLLYGTGVSSGFTAQGTTGQVLQSNGTAAPSWVNPNAALVTSDLIGSSVLSVTNGAGRVVGTGNANVDVVGTNGGVMYGTGTSSAFTPAGTVGQVLRSTGAGAPVWSSPNATLVTNNVTGGSVMNVTNGNNQVVGGTNMNIDVAGTQGGVLYGTGASSGFSAAGTSGQYLQSTGTGAPVWSTINTTTSDLTGSSVVAVSNGTNKVFGAGNAGVDVVGTNGGVLYGTGTSSGFTAAGTSGQVLRSNGAAAPTWVSGNSTLTTSSITGAGPITVTNGAGQTVGALNPAIDIRGTSGGVLYGTGAATSAAFSAVGTAGQYLQSTGSGAPVWATINTTTSDLTGSSVVTVTNGTGKVFGAGNAGVDVRGTNNGVMYGTGAATSATFTPASTAANQVLYTPTAGGTPTWRSVGGVHETIYRGTISVVNAPNYATGEQSVLGYTNVATGIYFSAESFGGYTAPVQPTNIRMPKCVVTAIYVSALLNTSPGTCTFQTYNVTTATATSFLPAVPAATSGNFTMTGAAVFNDGDIMALRNIPSIASGAIYPYRVEIDYYLLP